MKISTTKTFGSLNTKLTITIVFFVVFFVLPFSLFAQQRLESMCDSTFVVSGDNTVIDIENILVPKPGKTFGQVIVVEKEDEANNRGSARETAAIINVSEAGTYEIYARILYSDNVLKQFNESFFIQICEFSEEIACDGSSGFGQLDSCILPCDPNAGSDRVVVKDINVGNKKVLKQKAGAFVLEPGKYTIWFNHFSLIAEDFRKFLNPGANGQFCDPNANIDDCFNTDSVHLLSLEIRKVIPENPDLLVEKTVDKTTTQPGDTLAYSVAITNVSSDTVYNVKVTDDISDLSDKITFNQIRLTTPAGQFNTSQSFEPDRARFFFGNRISVTSEALSFSPADTMNVNLAPGQAIQIEYGVTLKDESFFTSFSDTLVNLAVATGSCEENISNNSASVTVVVTDTTEPPPPRNYDLEIEKTVSPGRVKPDSIFQYVLTITNTGHAMADSIVVTDLLPDTVSVDENSFNMAPDSTAANYLEWRIDSLAVGASAEIKFNAFVPGSLNLPPNQEFQFTNTSFVSAPRDTFPDNDSAAATIFVSTPDDSIDDGAANYDLGITKSVSGDSLDADSLFVYSIKVINNGPAPAGSITIWDILPDSVSVDESSFTAVPDSIAANYIEWHIDSLAVGATTEMRFNSFVPGSLNLPPDQEFSFTNQAFVNAPQDTFPDNDSATATWVVSTFDTSDTSEKYDLSIGKSVFADSLGLDSLFVYSLLIINNGPATADSIVVTDLLPDSIIVQEDSFTAPPDSVASNYLEWRINSMKAGAAVQFLFKAVVPGSLNLPPNQEFRFTNTSFVSAPQDTFPGNNSATATIVVSTEEDTSGNGSNKYDLAIEKFVSADSVGLDSVFAYTLRITNNGPVTTGVFSIFDVLSDSLTFDETSFNTVPDSGSGNILEWRFDSLAVDASLEISFSAFVSAAVSLPGNQYFSFKNEGLVVAAQDTFPDNDRATATIVISTDDDTSGVSDKYDLELNKNVDPDTVQQGRSFEYSLKVINKGVATAKDIALWDIFSDSIQVDFDSFNLELFSNNRDTLMWKIDSLAVGDSAVVTFDALVPLDLQLPEGDCTPFSNTATVYAANDTNRSNNSAEAVVCVIPPDDSCSYDLQLTKTVSQDTVHQGQLVEFRIDVINNNPCVATNVKIVDSIPAGLVYSNFEPQPSDPFATDTLRWIIPAIDSGKVFTITYNALYPRNNEITEPQSFVNSACLIAQNELNTSNNCDDAVVVYRPLTNCLAGGSSFYLDRNIFEPGKITGVLPEKLVITLNIDEISDITLDIFDITGSRIKRIAAGLQMGGENSYTWDGRTENGDYAGSGVYLIFVRDTATGGRKLECYLKVIVVQ